jgi:hypothetical protein
LLNLDKGMPKLRAPMENNGMWLILIYGWNLTTDGLSFPNILIIYIFLMISLVIPRTKSMTSYTIDVYLEPLFDDLIEFSKGIEAILFLRDGFNQINFKSLFIV